MNLIVRTFILYFLVSQFVFSCVDKGAYDVPVNSHKADKEGLSCSGCLTEAGLYVYKEQFSDCMMHYCKEKVDSVVFNKGKNTCKGLRLYIPDRDVGYDEISFNVDSFLTMSRIRLDILGFSLRENGDAYGHVFLDIGALDKILLDIQRDLGVQVPSDNTVLTSGFPKSFIVTFRKEGDMLWRKDRINFSTENLYSGVLINEILLKLNSQQLSVPPEIQLLVLPINYYTSALVDPYEVVAYKYRDGKRNR